MINTADTKWQIQGWIFHYSPEAHRVTATQPNGSPWDAVEAPNLATASRIVREWRSELGMGVVTRKKAPKAVYSKRLGRWVMAR